MAHTAQKQARSLVHCDVFSIDPAPLASFLYKPVLHSTVVVIFDQNGNSITFEQDDSIELGQVFRLLAELRRYAVRPCDHGVWLLDLLGRWLLWSETDHLPQGGAPGWLPGWLAYRGGYRGGYQGVQPTCWGLGFFFAGSCAGTRFFSYSLTMSGSMSHTFS